MWLNHLLYVLTVNLITGIQRERIDVMNARRQHIGRQIPAQISHKHIISLLPFGLYNEGNSRISVTIVNRKGHRINRIVEEMSGYMLNLA